MDDTEKRYVTTDITRALDLPFQRFRDWVDRGLVKPSIPSPGQGVAAGFTLWDIYMVQAFLMMTRDGFTRDTAAELLHAIPDDQVGIKGDRLSFMRSGGEVSAYLLDDPMSAILRHDYDDLYILNFRKIREFVDAKLEASQGE